MCPIIDLSFTLNVNKAFHYNFNSDDQLIPRVRFFILIYNLTKRCVTLSMYNAAYGFAVRLCLSAAVLPAYISLSGKAADMAFDNKRTI